MGGRLDSHKTERDDEQTNGQRCQNGRDPAGSSLQSVPQVDQSMFCFQPLSALKKLPLTLNSKSAYKPGPSIRDLRD